jgi:microcystin-dependent protein
MKKLIIGVVVSVVVLASLGTSQSVSADPFIGEVAWVPYGFAPRGWAFCDGQLLAISSNTALFSLLGTTYGGDGRTTFAIPDLRSRVIMHEGNGPGLTSRRLGEKAGEETVTLTISQMPQHSHNQQASSGTPTTNSPENNALASPSRTKIYADNADVAMHTATIGTAGGGQGHNNLQPYTVLNCIIATQGVYPSRS